MGNRYTKNNELTTKLKINFICNFILKLEQFQKLQKLYSINRTAR